MNLQYLNFIEGADTQLSPFTMADNKLEILDNCLVTYRLGAIVKRLGYTAESTTLQSGKSILGLYDYWATSSTQKMLAVVNNSAGTGLQLKYWDGAAWQSITTSTTWDTYENAKVEMETFLGYCFFVGYDSADGVFLPKASLTGTTFSTSTNVTSMPQGKYIVRYRDRLYVGNTYYSATAYPYRVYFSSVPSVGAITWTPATDFFDVDFARDITGMGSNWDRLLLFTKDSCYFYDQSNMKKMFDVGCSNHRTIKNNGAYLIWANGDGIWVSTGGRPENVAGRCMDFIKYATPNNFFSEVIDDEYHLYVGTVTVKGTEYINCDVIYNFATGTIRWHEYNDNFTIFAKFDVSGNKFLWGGTSTGLVMGFSKYTDETPVYSDNGSNIQAFFRTKPYDFGLTQDFKGITKMYAYADRAQGVQLKARVYARNSGSVMKPQHLGQLNNFITESSPDIDSGQLLQIEGVEISTNPYFSLYGFVLDVDQESKKR